jgi:hypothetical protein
MAKARLADASTGGDSVKHRGAGRRLTSRGNLSQRFPNGREDEPANLELLVITSDNICHIKSDGVGSDWLFDRSPSGGFQNEMASQFVGLIGGC